MKAVVISPKVLKYVKARSKGMTKNASKAVAGYSPNTMPKVIENSDAYKKLSVKDAILKHITLDEIAMEHNKVLRQEVDLGAKNTAIKMAYERIEPDSETLEDNDKVTVILK